MTFERIDPDNGVRLAGKPRHLVTHDRRLLALPAVRRDHDDGPARQSATPPFVVEALEGRADPGAARPVGYAGGGAAQRRLGVAALEIGGQARETRPESERLHPGPRA